MHKKVIIIFFRFHITPSKPIKKIVEAKFKAKGNVRSVFKLPKAGKSHIHLLTDQSIGTNQLSLVFLSSL
jgi:hypothetical protein